MAGSLRKIGIVFLLLSACLQSIAQSLHLHLENVSVKAAMEAVEKSSNFTFVYKVGDVDTRRVVSVHAKTLSKAVRQILAGQLVSYEVMGQNIILTKEAEQVRIDSSVRHMDVPVESGKRKVRKSEKTKVPKVCVVSGTIFDEEGKPIIGANIIEKGTARGTITDTQGRFSLSVRPHVRLLVSFIGYVTRELKVQAKKTEYTIYLNRSNRLLREVVVVGYGTQKKVNVTGAVAQVGDEVLSDRPLVNLFSGLQGTIGNLNITLPDGQPGTEATFNIRGNTNLSNANALVLVDGVEQDPNRLNPADIKEVSVLKDAASSAIYGAKAAYGVVLITTKSGSASLKPMVSFSANYSFNTPTVWYHGISSLQYADFMNACQQGQNGMDYYDDLEYEMIRNHCLYPAQYPNEVFHHPSDPANMWRYCANTDWNSVINKKVYASQQYNASVSGGNRAFRYYSSVGYYTQDGITKWYDDKFNRITNINKCSYTVNSWLEVGAKTSLAFQDRDDSRDAATYIQSNTRPTMPVFHPDGHFAGYDRFDITNTAAKHAMGGFFQKKYVDVLAAANVKVTLSKDLVVRGDYAFTYGHNAVKDYSRQYPNYDANGNVGSLSQKPGRLSYEHHESGHSVFNLYGEHQTQWGGGHELKCLLGFNQEYKRIYSECLSIENLINSNVPYVSLASGAKAVSDSESELATRGAFFRLNYDYAERYLVELNGRYDGSSRFPANNRFKLFPSFSAGWRLSNEPFWASAKSWANEFKLRASVGSLGNQVVSGYYPYVPAYGVTTMNYLFGGDKLLAIKAPNLVAANLTWETVTTFDVGTDMALFDNRLLLSFDWYTRATTDMLARGKQLPAVLGVDEPLMNVADLRVNGWEMQFDWRDKLGNGLRYGVGVTLSDYQGKITRYENPSRNLADHYVGERLGEIWGWHVDGLFQTDEEAASWNQSALSSFTLRSGDLKVADLNGNGMVDWGKGTADEPGDQTIIGNATPRYAFGFRGNLEWRQFDLAFFFQGIGRQDRELNWSRYYGSQWCIPVEWNLDYWTETNTDAFLPRPRFNADYGDYGVYDRYLVNGRYVRLKNLALGYTLPIYVTNQLHVRKLRVYFNADNVFTLSRMMKYHWDPELADDTTYPLMRQFSMGFNLTF